MQEIKYIIYARKGKKKKKHLQEPHLDFANALSSTQKTRAFAGHYPPLPSAEDWANNDISVFSNKTYMANIYVKYFLN